ncbi:Phage protein [Escherichia phage rV5_ev146]|uniref:Phage protein n=1 Tax=Escherichia phage rV5_ev146 TaxID=2695844 RepID=A0A653HBW6_9CAUD|nr:Phage protein [Escherichia phage rV5_ev146]
MKINFEKIVKRPHDSEELPERRQRNNKLNKPKRFGKIWRNHYDRKSPGLPVI